MLKEKGGRRREELKALGFGPISSLVWVKSDINLCYAVAERFWPKTSTFHFPFGEMVVTLEDVSYILGLPIAGKPLVALPCNNNEELIKRCLGKLPVDSDVLALALRGKIKLQWLRKEFGKLPTHANELEVQYYTRAYLLALCGCCLFPDTSGKFVDIRYLTILENLDDVGLYAWGAATLSYLYASLSAFALSSVYDLRGCVMLLQVWIHEHFPSIGRPVVQDGDYQICALKYVTSCRRYPQDPHHSLVIYRQEFDLVGDKDVVWAPYPQWPSALEKIVYHHSCLICLETVKHHPLDRCMRQCRFRQNVPEEPLAWDNTDSSPIDDWFDVLNNNSRFHIVGQRLHDNFADGVTTEYKSWYGCPILNNTGLVFEEQRFVPRGYRDDMAQVLLARCNNVANILDTLCASNTRVEELWETLRGLAISLRSTHDLQKRPEEHIIAPRRVVRFPNIASFQDNDDNDGYVPLSPEHEEPSDELDETMDEPDETMDESMRTNVIMDDDFLASEALHTSYGMSSSTQVPHTPPEMTPLHASLDFTQDASPYQVRRAPRDIHRVSTKVQMCFGCSKHGRNRCERHK
ncbi:protein-serine/threonine phosphatase [Ranunculus cassubicifolius]